MTKKDLRLLQELLSKFFMLHGISENDNEIYESISTMISDVFQQIHEDKVSLNEVSLNEK